MQSTDIQYMKLVKLLTQIEKRLTAVEAALQRRGPGRPPKKIEPPEKVNDAEH